VELTRLVVAVAALGIAVATSAALRLGIGRPLIVAGARGAAQLALVGLLLELVFERTGLTVVFVAVMLTAAALTTARRWGPVPGAVARAATALAVGSGGVLALTVASGAFPRLPQAVIPLIGILLGGSMTAASLAGRRFVEDVERELAQIELRLMLGDSAWRAVLPSMRHAVVTGLIPAIDQTRNVGLVTLPGTFVGMLFAGATPIEAARVQLSLLFLLLGAETIAAVCGVALIARVYLVPGERVVLPVQHASGRP
jgi:putative ABC transport system permease protein